nr:MAG TPA: hypothetical protein [Caudoviricetes sp.]
MIGYHFKYKSDYPNQVHQLNMSISQNYYLLKNGEIKYQLKKFDINWNNYERTGKRHIVNFLIRDHFSNCFYAEIYPIDEMPHIEYFLFNAWKQKNNFAFCGIPHCLILGRHIINRFPEIQNLSHTANVNIQLANNGFATGIRSMRDWETNMRFFASYPDLKQIESFQKYSEYICRDINSRNTGKTEPNLLKWEQNNPRGLIVNDFTEFEKLFSE